MSPRVKEQPTQPEDPWYERARELAREQYGRDGEIEIDEGCVISDSDNGNDYREAYVAAWVFVSDEDTPLEDDPEICECGRPWDDCCAARVRRQRRAGNLLRPGRLQ